MVIFEKSIPVQAVIFDFDGVIVDTEPLHYQAFQQILSPRGLGFSWDQYVETYMGFDDRDAFTEAFKTKDSVIDQQELAGLISEKALIFQAIVQTGIKAYPGVVDLIRSLFDAKLPLAICSGALRSDILPILEQLNISHCFDIIISADDVAKSKPDPESYRVAFDRLRTSRPESMLTATATFAIEDTPAGIAAASLAGLQVIAVTNSYTQEHLTGARYTVNSLERLLEIHSA
jgi:beta-phosphoglucomutase